MDSPNSSIDALFDDSRRGLSQDLEIEDLAYLARPIVEHIHEERPDVIVAGDRGARLLAITVFGSWKKRFPEEQFPTLDRKLHLTRVTGFTLPRQVQKAIHFTLENAGLVKGQSSFEDGKTPKVLFIDDWVNRAETIRRFTKAVKSFGLPEDSVFYATMCGPQSGYPRHLISDPSRNNRWAVWKQETDYVGVNYANSHPIVPIANRNSLSIAAREQIKSSIDRYYKEFTNSRALGKTASHA